MKHVLTSLLLISLIPAQSFAQLDSTKLDSATVDSLIATYIDSYDPYGSVTFKDSSLRTGELFTLYKNYLVDDSSSSFMLMNSHIDPLIGNHHNKYEQHYFGIPIDGAEMVEHSRGGYTYRIGGLYANPTKDTTGKISKSDALIALDSYYEGWTGEEQWAWKNDEWESALKAESENEDTTYYPYPTATLIWAVYNYKKLRFEIPDSCIRLAWRFELHCLNPSFIRHYYVDAFTGEVFDYDDLVNTDGPAEILTYGQQIIDTKSRGWPYNDYILKTDGGGKNIHTKEFYGSGSTSNQNGQPFFLAPNIDDDDDDWGQSHQPASTAHWMVSKAWEYFDDVFDHPGTKGNGNKIKIRSDGPIDISGTLYNNGDKIVVSWADEETYMGVLDIIAHEYAHGIVRHTAKLKYKRESGALNESFADIFGTLVERYTEDLLGIAAPDWDIGEDTPATWVLRNLEEPTSAGDHYDAEIVPCTYARELGQPDTYEGNFWYFEDDRDESDQCDNYGVHVNSGVQNKWFQLLADGGTHNGVSVLGIGMEDAAEIAYYTLSTSLGKNSQYTHARLYSTAAALDIFGTCSIQRQSVSDAWDAVEVPGIPVFCFPQGEDALSNTVNDLIIYPNPSTGSFVLKSGRPLIGTIDINSIDGKRLYQYSGNGRREMTINLSLPTGFYILSLHDASGVYTQRVVVQ